MFKTLPRPLIVDSRSDGHVHTKWCRHATGEMEDYVQEGLQRGLREIIFLEHMEEGIITSRTTWLSEDEFDLYFAEGKRLQEKYRGQIAVKIGVEVGYNPACTEKILHRLSTRAWDKIGLSYHFLPVKNEPHINLLSSRPEHSLRVRQRSPHKIAEQYLDGLIKAVEIFPVHAVCHLDAALRHIPEISFAKHHLAKVRQLLAIIQRKGIALEINTSGFDYRNECFPAHSIIAIAQEMGVLFVAGSDAHSPKDVGRYFDRFPT
ncbi:histidinol-phosphatase [Desulfotalea psychrophila]|uniref:Histidinol-phosphatase n=1 Tax=Desulfotalea psychrophila (strain LSv54 / DSM 12343) TaxID=177439 RepID=Q6AJ63_DESPS|nr:histidinol-phosphatase [Desulfotalea psychrophila]CAG37617.1 related to histidinol-phosphatase [Desulfotalea psychrophila LSv54]